MQEYVFTIAVRDPEHPLGQVPLIEFGVNTEASQKFTGAISNIVEMLKLLKTPEKVAEFMRDNASLAKGTILNHEGK